jgi:aspartate aminotransferase-like enzyme
MGRETVSFNDVHFVAQFNNLISDMKELWRCDGLVFIVAGSGTMAMEMSVSNVAASGESVLICSNGHFGDRFVEICARKDLDIDTIKAPWGQSVGIDEIDRKLSEKKYHVLVVTHIETSTAVELPLYALAKMMRDKHPEVLLVVDGVASVGSVEFYMDWGIDIMLTCSQKGLGLAPGLGIVWASKRAIEKRQGMPPINESYVDFIKWIPVMKDTMQYWGTPPVNMIWALAEAIRIIKNEGLSEREKRHRLYADAIRKSLAVLGFRSGVDENCSAATVSVFFYPDGANIDDAKFRATVYEEGAHIAACLGEFTGRGFRIGHMGNITPAILLSLVASIERACFRCGCEIALGSGLAVLQKELIKTG